MIDNNIIFYICALIALIILLNKKENYLDLKERYDIEAISNFSSLLKEDKIILPSLKLTGKVKGNLKNGQKINGDLKVDSVAHMKRLGMGRTQYNYNYTGTNWIDAFPHDHDGFVVRTHDKNHCGSIYLALRDERYLRGC